MEDEESMIIMIVALFFFLLGIVFEIFPLLVMGIIPILACVIWVLLKHNFIVRYEKRDIF